MQLKLKKIIKTIYLVTNEAFTPPLKGRYLANSVNVNAQCKITLRKI